MSMRVYIVLLGALSACRPTVGQADPSRPAAPVLETAAVRIGFDPRSGRLTSLLDRARSFELIDSASTQGLWSIDCPDGSRVTPAQAGRFSWGADPGAPARLRLSWSDLGVKAAPRLEVHVEVALDDGGGPASRWRIRLEGPGEMGVISVRFPRLGALRAQDGETLSAPVWIGEQTRQARAWLNPAGKPAGRWEWMYPGLLSMQCLDWTNAAGNGFVLSAVDPNALGKRFAVLGDGRNGLMMEVVHLPQGDPAAPRRHEVPYDVVVTPHEGGWYGAAQVYAAWARGQQWVTRSRLRTGAVPPWLLDTGLWVWNRGRSDEVLEPALVLKRHAGLPVSVFWHWWHGCAYDAGFPEYLPPREGAEPFRKALAAAHDQDLHAIVYMNQRLWGMTTASWTAEGAERFAVKRPDGKVTPEVYNRFLPVACASMCMGTPFWREKYAGLATAAVTELGVDGIYMDQACTSLACFDPTHGHPLGGGGYWIEGFRQLESEIRRRCAASGPVTLAGEGCGEAWLPHLDAMLCLQVSMERYAAPGVWEPIPFFHAVYHDGAILYGNYSSLTRPPYDALWPRETAPSDPLALLDRKFSTQFRLEQARAFAWGQQPTIANFVPSLLETRRAEIEFVLQLARLRRRLLPFLQQGTMLQPLAIDAPSVTIPMSRLSIYAGQRDAVKEFVETVPQLVSSAWRAPDGRVALVLVNIGETPIRPNLGLADQPYPIAPTGTLELFDFAADSTTRPYQRTTLRLDDPVGPAAARVVVFPGGAVR